MIFCMFSTVLERILRFVFIWRHQHAKMLLCCVLLWVPKFFCVVHVLETTMESKMAEANGMFPIFFSPSFSIIIVIWLELARIFLSGILQYNASPKISSPPISTTKNDKPSSSSSPQLEACNGPAKQMCFDAPPKICRHACGALLGAALHWASLTSWKCDEDKRKYNQLFFPFWEKKAWDMDYILLIIRE